MTKTKTDKILSVIYRVFGAFVFICFASYFLKLVISPEGTLPWIATTLVMTFTAGPYLLRTALRRALGRAFLPFKAAFCLAFVFYTVTFAALVAYIYIPKDTGESIPADAERVYIVFGARVKEDGPTKTLAARLDLAIDEMRAHPDALCIVSGGQGPNEPRSEAETMRDYMTERGIAAERIIIEDKATDTNENIAYSLDVIKEMGLEEYSLVCVSTDTHIPRIRLMCRRLGVTSAYLSAETPHKEFLFTTWVREYLSFAKMYLGV